MHLIIPASLSESAYVAVNPTMRWGEAAATLTRNLLKRSRAMVAGQRLTGRHPALQHSFYVKDGHMERGNNESPTESMQIDTLEMEKIDRDIKRKILLGIAAVCGAAAMSIIWFFF
jgi:hypothetical protein